jgi:hypothetical protein
MGSIPTQDLVLCVLAKGAEHEGDRTQRVPVRIGVIRGKPCLRFRSLDIERT